MSNTYEYGGKVYRIVPDWPLYEGSDLACPRCAFDKDKEACRMQTRPMSDNCLTGNHHYVLDEEQV